MAVALKPNRKVVEVAPLPLAGIEKSAIFGRQRRWTAKEYCGLIEAGFLTEDEHVELLDGYIIEMSPQTDPHYYSVEQAADLCRSVFGRGFTIRPQGGIALSGRSVPEPDVTVARGTRADYADRKPTPADTVLVIEVSSSSLRQDRGVKAMLYATAGIADYWIVNLKNRTVEVYRDPSDESAGSYKTVSTFREGESISPLAAPGKAIRVADLLPPKRKTIPTAE